MKTLLFPLPVITLLSAPAMGAISYFEDFGEERADGTYPYSVEDWSAFFSNTATSDNASAVIHNAGSTRGGIAEGTSWSGNTSSYLFIQNQPTGSRSDFFMFTSTGIDFVPSSGTTVSWASSRASFSFSSMNANASSTYHFALQINSGSWYAVTTNYSGSNNVSFNLNAATFYSITFGGVNEAMSIDTGSFSTFVSLFGSGQSVTGIGFYGTIAAGVPATTDPVALAVMRTLRIDNLSIVPEPGSAVLAGLSVLGLMLKRRR
jgi:hypothetical protein